MFENGNSETYSLDGYPESLENIGEGLAAIDNTVKKMIQVIRESAKNMRIRNKATGIIYGIPEKDQYREADAIYNWVRNNTRYTKDMQGTELLQSPLIALDMIERGFAFQGDCDDQTMLVLSLMKSVGFPVAIRIAGYKNDGKYSHVYGLVNIYGNQWIPVEPIKRDVTLGWESPNPKRTKDYEV